MKKSIMVGMGILKYIFVQIIVFSAQTLSTRFNNLRSHVNRPRCYFQGVNFFRLQKKDALLARPLNRQAFVLRTSPRGMVISLEISTSPVSKLYTSRLKLSLSSAVTTMSS